MELDAFTFRIAAQLFLATLLGLVMGFEREYRGKAAGLRTFALVTLGAALFTILSIEGFAAFIGTSNADPTRLASQIVVGVGFLGAGLIFAHGNEVRGLTTAAGLWTAAGVGMAVGLQLYTISIFVTLLILFLMLLVKKVEIVLPRAEGD